MLLEGNWRTFFKITLEPLRIQAQSLVALPKLLVFYNKILYHQSRLKYFDNVHFTDQTLRFFNYYLLKNYNTFISDLVSVIDLNIRIRSVVCQMLKRDCYVFYRLVFNSLRNQSCGHYQGYELETYITSSK